MQANSSSGSPWGWMVAVTLGALALAGLSVYREGQRGPVTVANPAACAEGPIVEMAMEAQAQQLPTDTFGLGDRERSLLLKVNGDLGRSFEVAGGLLAIAQQHLAQSNATEAMRVAQICADLVPNTVTSARSWILCGHASAYSHPDLPLSLRYLERADQTLLGILSKMPDDKQALKLRSSLLLDLGQTEAKFQRTESAIAHLRELTGDGPVAQNQNAEGRMRATLALSQLLGQPVPTEESEKLRAIAWNLGTTEDVPAAAALHVLRESIPQATPANESLFAPPPVEPSAAQTRTEGLLTLWNTKRFRGLPEWFQIGDELASNSFFHEPRQSADFEIVNRQLLVSMPPSLASLAADSPEKEELESIYAANLLLAVSTARDRGDQSEVDRLTRMFEETFRDRDITFTTPMVRPAQRMHRIGEIYRTTMLGHIEQMRQRLECPGKPPE